MPIDKYIKIGKAKAVYLSRRGFQKQSGAVWKLGDIYVSRIMRPVSWLRHIKEYVDREVYINQYSGEVLVREQAHD